VQVMFQISEQFEQETIRLPFVCEEWNTDRFSESVELETSDGDPRHDAGIVDDFEIDLLFFAPPQQIHVGGSTERVSNDQNTYIVLMC